MSEAAKAVNGLEAHIDRLEARLAATQAVLTDRERELLLLKGPCSDKYCRLHYAHSGPCDVKGSR